MRKFVYFILSVICFSLIATIAVAQDSGQELAPQYAQNICEQQCGAKKVVKTFITHPPSDSRGVVVEMDDRGIHLYVHDPEGTGGWVAEIPLHPMIKKVFVADKKGRPIGDVCQLNGKSTCMLKMVDAMYPGSTFQQMFGWTSKPEKAEVYQVRESLFVALPWIHIETYILSQEGGSVPYGHGNICDCSKWNPSNMRKEYNTVKKGWWEVINSFCGFTEDIYYD